MKRITFMLAMLVMLALMGCKDSKDSNDEPDYNKPPRIYMAINDRYVFDIEGNAIYECPRNSYIIKLASEGKDWYAVRSRHVDNNTVLYEVLKNGTVQFQTPYWIESMCVENGDVYTLQLDESESIDYYLIYKNDQQLYKYDAHDYNFLYNSFDVVDGHLVAGIGSWNPPTYWIDGNKLTLDIGNLTSYQATLKAYAREGAEDLFVVGDNSYRHWYQFKGQFHELPSDIDVIQAMMVDGIPYILAKNDIEEQDLLYINGVEYPLITPHMDYEFVWWRGLMRRYGNDVYVLITTTGNIHSQIYKRNEPIDMSAHIELKDVYGNEEHKVPLSDCSITDFIVLPPQ